jgi:DNA-binding CsgD family transcriptional regulator
MDVLGDGVVAELKIGLAAEKDFLLSLQEIKRVFGVDHAVYHLAPMATPGMEIPFVRTTYSADWIMRYIVSNYMSSDPVLAHGLSDAKPFFWSELPRASPAVDAFFKDAIEHGVGNCGYSVPISDRGGKRAMFTLNKTAEPVSFKAWVAPMERHIKDIAQILHKRALAEVGASDPVPLLSRREIECLNWTAQGKDASSIAEILTISEHTVRDYLKFARTKLGCATIAQAVYEATRLNLIKP